MTKTVALADDAYDALSRLKTPGQSFSDVVRGLVAERRPRLSDLLEPPTPESAEFWAKFQKERHAARAKRLSRVTFEE